MKLAYALVCNAVHSQVAEPLDFNWDLIVISPITLLYESLAFLPFGVFVGRVRAIIESVIWQWAEPFLFYMEIDEAKCHFLMGNYAICNAELLE